MPWPDTRLGRDLPFHLEATNVGNGLISDTCYAPRLALAGHPRALRPLRDLLQPLRQLAESRDLGSASRRDLSRLRWRYRDNRLVLRSRPPAWRGGPRPAQGRIRERPQRKFRSVFFSFGAELIGHRRIIRPGPARAQPLEFHP